jgi:hypothetical protein
MEYIYLVCEYGYEYDDNNYYRVDNAANPRTAYYNEEQAEQACKVLNVSEFKSIFTSGNLNDYGEYPNLIKDKCKTKADKLCKKLFKLKVEDCWNLESPLKVDHVTNEQWEELYSYFYVNWYFVRKVVLTKNN